MSITKAEILYAQLFAEVRTLISEAVPAEYSGVIITQKGAYFVQREWPHDRVWYGDLRAEERAYVAARMDVRLGSMTLLEFAQTHGITAVPAMSTIVDADETSSIPE